VKKVKMDESVVKKIDQQGRVSIPIEWRREWKSDKVILRKRGESIELMPVKPLPPSSLFDSIEISEKVDFTDPHSLKEALMEQKS
jgi:bifunctional DNA-binding transcriptional regulator/antitoxin component of YhaV-PrlF toxin-antitoxin module